MTVINQLIKKLSGVTELCEKLKTAEKAQAIEIKAEANALFKVQRWLLNIAYLLHIYHYLEILCAGLPC